MADSKRQQIVSVITDAIKTIKTADGYETNVGNTVDDWRTDWQEEELPAVSICDLTEETIENAADEFLDFYKLPVQIRAFTSSATRAADARKIEADIWQAIRPLKNGFAVGNGQNRVVLAKQIDLRRSGFVLAEDGFRITGVAVEIEILYYTKKFNAYE